MGCDSRGSLDQRIQPGLGDENLRGRRQNLLFPRNLKRGGGKSKRSREALLHHTLWNKLWKFQEVRSNQITRSRQIRILKRSAGVWVVPCSGEWGDTDPLRTLSSQNGSFPLGGCLYFSWSKSSTHPKKLEQEYYHHSDERPLMSLLIELCSLLRKTYLTNYGD